MLVTNAGVNDGLNIALPEIAKLAGMGGFAQYIVVKHEKIHYSGIYEIPDGVSYDDASSGSVFACLENEKVGYSDTVVIIGAGPIGDFMAQLTKTGEAIKVVLHPWD